MGKLTIQDVARILTEKNGLTQREANQFATEMFGVILQHLQQDEQVKVKGLGTFKIINVEARESVSVRTGERVVIDSHSKVTFTPDATMKELVNRPFSQFETVVLNEGVEFSDLNVQDDDADEEEESRVEPAESASPIEDAQPEVVSEEQPESVSEEQLESVSEEQPVPETEQPVPETEQQAPEEPSPVKEEQPIVDEFVVEEEEGSNVMKVLLGVLCILLLMLGSAYGGYRYGCGQSAVIMHDTVIIRDTIYADSLKKEAAVVDDKKEAPKAEEQKPAEAEKQSAEAEKKPATDVLDKWSAKDDRVRLGAYRIVGTAEEVTVQQGQTFYSICKAYLGPDMECYVEVYNDLPRRPQIQAGQKLKIPKLEWKKRRK